VRWGECCCTLAVYAEAGGSNFMRQACGERLAIVAGKLSSWIADSASTKRQPSFVVRNLNGAPAHKFPDHSVAGDDRCAHDLFLGPPMNRVQ
jgi:hypothetical protein